MDGQMRFLRRVACMDPLKIYRPGEKLLQHDKEAKWRNEYQAFEHSKSYGAATVEESLGLPPTVDF